MARLRASHHAFIWRSPHSVDNTVARDISTRSGSGSGVEERTKIFLKKKNSADEILTVMYNTY